MYGFTGNYIKTEYPFHPELINTVVKCRLIGLTTVSVALAAELSYFIWELKRDSSKNTVQTVQATAKFNAAHSLDSVKACHPNLFKYAIEYEVPATIPSLLHIRDIDTLLGTTVGKDIMAELSLMDKGYSVTSDTISIYFHYKLPKNGTGAPSDKKLARRAYSLFSTLSEIRADFNKYFNKFAGHRTLHGNNRWVLNVAVSAFVATMKENRISYRAGYYFFNESLKSKTLNCETSSFLFCALASEKGLDMGLLPLNKKNQSGHALAIRNNGKDSFSEVVETTLALGPHYDYDIILDDFSQYIQPGKKEYDNINKDGSVSFQLDQLLPVALRIYSCNP